MENLKKELIVDNFAGGGGASTGIGLARCGNTVPPLFAEALVSESAGDVREEV